MNNQITLKIDPAFYDSPQQKLESVETIQAG